MLNIHKNFSIIPYYEQPVLSIAKINKLILAVISIFSLILIFMQYFLRDGLWRDELMIMDTFFEGWSDIFKPLKNEQVAPILFLIIERALFSLANLVSVLPEYFMKIYTILCGIGVIILYYPTIKRYTASSTIALFSTFFLIFAPQFIDYTSEVKQYICELLCTVLILYVYSFKNSSRKYTIIFCATVFYCVLSSHVICFALLPLGIYDTYILLYKHKFNLRKVIYDKEFIQYLIMYGFSLTLLVIYYYLFLYDHPTKDYMNDWWNRYFFTLDDWDGHMNRNLNYMYSDKNKNYLFFLMLGLLSLAFIRNKFLFIFSSILLSCSLLFSYLKLYPAAIRLLLYWHTITALCFGTLLYFSLKLVLYPIFRKYAFFAISICGCIIISTYWLSKSYNLPIIMKLPPTKKIYQVFNQEFKKGDIAVVSHWDIGSKYEQTYWYNNPNKFIYMRPSWDEKTGDLEDENLPYKKLLEIIDFPKTHISHESHINQKIILMFFSEKINSYNRSWLVMEQSSLDTEYVEYNKKSIESKLQHIIEKIQSKKVVEKCFIIDDTVICLINNEPAEDLLDIYNFLKIEIAESKSKKY